MPRAPRLCTHVDCYEIVTGGTRCEDHKLRDNRPSSSARGYDTRWHAARAAHLEAEPYCRTHAGKGEQVTANEVDHIDGLGPNGPRGFDPANLQSLCKPCHSSKTAKEHLNLTGYGVEQPHWRHNYDTCPNGHPYEHDGRQRRCMTCRRESDRKRREGHATITLG